MFNATILVEVPAVTHWTLQLFHSHFLKSTINKVVFSANTDNYVKLAAI